MCRYRFALYLRNVKTFYDRSSGRELNLTVNFHVPNHGKLWKSLMRAHLGEYEALEAELQSLSGREALTGG
jgi:hypothetical protein